MVRLLRRRYCGSWCFLVTADWAPVPLLRAIAKLFSRPCYFFRRNTRDPASYRCLNPPPDNPGIELYATLIATMLRRPPYPTQRSLDQMLASVTRVVVSQVGRGRPALEQTIDDPASILSLRQALQIDQRCTTVLHWSVCTDIRLVLHRGDLSQETLDLRHSRLHWDGWPLDEPTFIQPTLLQTWLAGCGFQWHPEDSDLAHA